MSPSAQVGYAPHRERRVAYGMIAGVLLALTVAKSIGSIPIISTILFTAIALAQLYAPVWRCDRLGLDLSFVGLHTHAWRRDLTLCFKLCALFFPIYAVLHHMWITGMHGWLVRAGLPTLATWFPHAIWAPELPTDWPSALGLGWTGCMLLTTHTLGIALPEETFYRGYVQTQLETRFVPQRRILGVPIGRAAVIASGLFALGHFLGEWHPARLGPFFPGLVFAWQRNATQSIWGAVAFHATCNVFSVMLFHLYRVT